MTATLSAGNPVVNTATVSGGGDPGCPAAALQLNDDDTVECTATDGNEDRKRGIVCSRCTSQLHTATEQHGHGGDDGGDHDHRHHPNRADDWHLASGLHGSGADGHLHSGRRLGGWWQHEFRDSGDTDAGGDAVSDEHGDGERWWRQHRPAAARCSGTVTTPVNAPQLTVTKTAAPGSFVIGVPASHTLQLSNTGTAATTAAATITDTIPTGVTIGTLPAGCTAAGQTVTCTVAAGLAVGGSTSFVIPVTPTASAANWW